METSATPGKRIALIAIHGVGEHAPGAMARSVAWTLQADGTTPYAAVADDPVLLMPPEAAARSWTVLLHKPKQRFLDFGFGSPFRDASAATPDRTVDAFPMDIHFTASQVSDAHPDPAPYATPRIRLLRPASKPQAAPVEVDVHELHWSDLSRASTSAWAVAGDLVQLLVHIASLGRTVAAAAQARVQRQAAGPGASRALRGRALLWKAQFALQSACYFLFASPIVIATLILPFLLALFFLDARLFGGPQDTLLRRIAFEQGDLETLWTCAQLALHFSPALAVGAIVTLLSAIVPLSRAWRKPPAPISQGNPILRPAFTGLGAGLLVFGLSQLSEHAELHLLRALVALLVLAPLGGLLYLYKKTRPGALTVGLVLLAVLAVIGYRIGSLGAAPLQTAGERAAFSSATALLGAMEALAWILAWIWASYLCVMLASLLLGAACAVLGSDPDRRSAHTAMLASLISPALFLIVSFLVGVSVVGALGSVFPDMPWQYTSHFFFPEAEPFPHDDCLRGCTAGNDFLLTLVALASNSSFQAFTAAALIAVALAALAVLPGVSMEFFPPAPTAPEADQRSQSLGIVLSKGLGHIGLAGVVLVSGMIGLLVPAWALLVAHDVPFAKDAQPSLPYAWILGTATVGIGALSGRLFKVLARLRTVVDTALDVDNWLRERPQGDTPRWRILDRFERLLRHVDQGQYDAVLIVAHSQGTVIAADCLRFLKCYPHGGAILSTPVYLCTFGSPLRQLYAERFADLYAWVVQAPGATQAGPDPLALGAVTWINGFCSGDYIGRALWHPTNRAATFTVPAGRAQVADMVRAAFAAGEAADDYAAADICFGAGAHTRYFDGVNPLIFTTLDTVIEQIAN